MPTPGGRLRVGDRIRHPDEPGVVFTVTHRSRGDNYAIKFAREDGRSFMFSGYRKSEHMLLNAHYLIFTMDGGWRLMG